MMNEVLYSISTKQKVANTIQMRQTPIGTPFYASCASGAVTLKPLPPQIFPFVSDAGANALLDYLVDLFGRLVSRTHLTEMMKNVFAAADSPWKNDECTRLFWASERLLQNRRDPAYPEHYALPERLSIPKRSTRRMIWLPYYDAARPEADHVCFVKRYQKGHANLLMLPPAIRDETGWSWGEMLSCLERPDDNTYVIRPTTTEEEAYARRADPITEAGTVHGFRYLYLTKTQRKALGIGKELYYEGVNLKFTFDFVDRHCIIVEPLAENERETIPLMTKGCKLNWDRMFVMQRHINGPIILPAEFCRRYGVQKNDVLTTDLRGNQLYIYGRLERCDISGEIHERNEMTHLPVCADCADVMPEVRQTVEDCGSIAAALAKTAEELLTLSKKLEHEGGHI